MPRYAQFVIGPAGSGKSTYVTEMHRYMTLLKREVSCFNLDPAAESFNYPVSLDIRDLISVSDVQEGLGLGPNGALVYCFEYLIQNMEWFVGEIEGEESFVDDYLLIDCPGQIELYTHINYLRIIMDKLEELNYKVMVVNMIDAFHIVDPLRFGSSMLMALSSMVLFEKPHLNILTKIDTLPEEERQELASESGYYVPDMYARQLSLENELATRNWSKRKKRKFRKLDRALMSVIEEYSMVGFIPLDYREDDSLPTVSLQIDIALQYGEEEDIDDTLF